MATPYQNIAKEALINWNGLNTEEAERKIKEESVSELEGQVFAMDSVKYAIAGITKELKLSQEEMEEFTQSTIYGPEDAEIFEKIAKAAQSMTEEQQLNILSTIHDGWVVNNSSEKTFNKKVDRNQLRQYAPLELIGWNEVESDLLFLDPILSAINVNVDRNSLEEAYHQRVANYMEKENVNSKTDLTNLVSQGRLYYPTLPAELEERLNPLSQTVSTQIIENWQGKDKKSAQIFTERSEKDTNKQM